MHNFGRNLGYVLHSLRLCMFPLASALVAVVVLLGVPQGHETLRAIAAFGPDQQAEPNELSRVVSFFFGYAAWGLANWYASRLLLGQEAPKEHKARKAGAASPETRFIEKWRIRFPRVFPLLAMIIVAFDMPDDGSSKYPIAQFAAFGSTAAVALFIGLRRSLLKIKGGPNGRFSELPPGDRRTLVVALVLSFVLMLALPCDNVAIARTLGAPALLFLALSSITLFGAIVLVYLPISLDWPQITWLPILLALLWAQLEWNHDHRLSDREGFGVSHEIYPADQRPAVGDQFAFWLDHYPQQAKAKAKAEANGAGATAADTNASGGVKAVATEVSGVPPAVVDDPIFLVAAEGGASRSGWWVAHVLGSADYVTHGEFSRRVFAVSGISGGSLGAATWVALLARGRGAAASPPAPAASFPTARDCATLARDHRNWPMPTQSECFVGRDVLSTTIGYLLFPDLFQRFMPFRNTHWDRSRGLEDAWKQDWHDVFGDDTFDKPLMALYRTDAASAASGAGAAASGPASRLLRFDLPLLLNSTRAGLGRPVLQAPVTIHTAEADDLFADWPQARGLPLAAVVHNSARFPIVSPGGEIVRGDPYPAATGPLHPRAWDSLVDGGYFENSGSFALLQMLKDIEARYVSHDRLHGEATWNAILKRIRILFITNDVPAANDETQYCVESKPCDAFPIRQEELLTPLIGLYEPRSSRAGASMRALLDYLGQARAMSFTLAMDGDQVIAQQPSMNWYLTTKSRRVMWNSFHDSQERAPATAGKAASAADAQGQARPNPGPARNTAYEQMCALVHATPVSPAASSAEQECAELLQLSVKTE